MSLGLSNHVVVITGAGSGIGKAIAERFAQEGSQLVLLDLNHSSVEKLAAKINVEGGSAKAYGVDVTSSSNVNAVIEDAYKTFGVFHVLVNCAGFSIDAPLIDMTDQQWEKVLGVCLTGAFYCVRAVAPYMLEAKYGRIINISSRALNGDKNKANYSSAKAGLVGLTKALSLELGEAGITANVVAPGIIDTPRFRANPFFSEIEARSKADMPIKRLGETKEVAHAVIFLASADSGFITGETLYVSGGRYG